MGGHVSPFGMIRRALRGYGARDALLTVLCLSRVAFLAHRRTARTAVTQSLLPGVGHSIYLRPASTDLDVYDQIFLQRQYELTDFAQFDQAPFRSAQRQLIIDCGAYIGLSSIWFAQHFPNAIVCAIEPDPENFALLQMNTKKHANIVPINAAIWNKDCNLVAIDESDEKWRMAFAEDNPKDKAISAKAIPAITIAEVMRRFGASDCLIVKIDIEGGESSLFRSEIEWLSKTRLVIMELHDWLLPWRHVSQPFLAAINAHDYDLTIRGENLFCFRYPTTRADHDVAPVIAASY